MKIFAICFTDLLPPARADANGGDMLIWYTVEHGSKNFVFRVFKQQA